MSTPVPPRKSFHEFHPIGGVTHLIRLDRMALAGGHCVAPPPGRGRMEAPPAADASPRTICLECSGISADSIDFSNGAWRVLPSCESCPRTSPVNPSPSPSSQPLGQLSEQPLEASSAFFDVKEIPLTAHDQAIVRELWVRGVSYALHGSSGTPKDQRVLEVWNAWRNKTDEYMNAASGQPTFCGHPLERVTSPAGTTHRWELARPVWEAACVATRQVRRYIRAAADAAVTAGYVPTRAGILDPLLRNPMQVLFLLFVKFPVHSDRSIGLSRIVRIVGNIIVTLCQNLTGSFDHSTVFRSFL
jgi:hypothetical protein